MSEQLSTREHNSKTATEKLFLCLCRLEDLRQLWPNGWEHVTAS
jgi:hypothetical protein